MHHLFTPTPKTKGRALLCLVYCYCPCRPREGAQHICYSQRQVFQRFFVFLSPSCLSEGHAHNVLLFFLHWLGSHWRKSEPASQVCLPSLAPVMWHFSGFFPSYIFHHWHLGIDVPLTYCIILFLLGQSTVSGFISFLLFKIGKGNTDSVHTPESIFRIRLHSNRLEPPLHSRGGSNSAKDLCKEFHGFTAAALCKTSDCFLQVWGPGTVLRRGGKGNEEQTPWHTLKRLDYFSKKLITKSKLYFLTCIWNLKILSEAKWILFGLDHTSSPLWSWPNLSQPFSVLIYVVGAVVQLPNAQRWEGPRSIRKGHQMLAHRGLQEVLGGDLMSIPVIIIIIINV